ncbi:MAG: hypothetical protein FWB99_07735 [Treponema sp.]|nr:hypothetical protein [Treponema sp.]
MKKAFLFLGCAMFILSACISVPAPAPVSASAQRQGESGRWIAGTQDGALVVIGVANRHLRRQDEISAAKQSAAGKVAMFYGMSGMIESILRTDGGVLGFAADSRITLNPAFDYRHFIDRLHFDADYDVFEINGGTLIQFRYEARVTPVNFAGVMEADGRPNWANGHLPVVSGYTAAVGVSQNQLWLRDTVTRSVHAAAARLIEGGATTVRSAVTETGIGTASYIITRSEGVLNNFRVLEFWINPENGYVYTLGIARVVE